MKPGCVVSSSLTVLEVWKEKETEKEDVETVRGKFTLFSDISHLKEGEKGMKTRVIVENADLEESQKSGFTLTLIFDCQNFDRCRNK